MQIRFRHFLYSVIAGVGVSGALVPTSKADEVISASVEEGEKIAKQLEKALERARALREEAKAAEDELRKEIESTEPAQALLDSASPEEKAAVKKYRDSLRSDTYIFSDDFAKFLELPKGDSRKIDLDQAFNRDRSSEEIAYMLDTISFGPYMRDFLALQKIFLDKDLDLRIRISAIRVLAKFAGSDIESEITKSLIQLIDSIDRSEEPLKLDTFKNRVLRFLAKFSDENTFNYFRARIISDPSLHGRMWTMGLLLNENRDLAKKLEKDLGVNFSKFIKSAFRDPNNVLNGLK